MSAIAILSMTRTLSGRKCKANRINNGGSLQPFGRPNESLMAIHTISILVKKFIKHRDVIFQ